MGLDGMEMARDDWTLTLGETLDLPPVKRHGGLPIIHIDVSTVLSLILISVPGV